MRPAMQALRRPAREPRTAAAHGPPWKDESTFRYAVRAFAEIKSAERRTVWPAEWLVLAGVDLARPFPSRRYQRAMQAAETAGREFLATLRKYRKARAASDREQRETDRAHAHLSPFGKRETSRDAELLKMLETIEHHVHMMTVFDRHLAERPHDARSALVQRVAGMFAPVFDVKPNGTDLAALSILTGVAFVGVRAWRNTTLAAFWKHERDAMNKALREVRRREKTYP